MKKGKLLGTIIALVIIAGGAVWAVYHFRADEVPDHILEQFENDSSTTTDTSEINDLNDLFNDPEFDFDEEPDADSSNVVDDTVMSV